MHVHFSHTEWPAGSAGLPDRLRSGSWAVHTVGTFESHDNDIMLMPVDEASVDLRRTGLVLDKLNALSNSTHPVS